MLTNFDMLSLAILIDLMSDMSWRYETVEILISLVVWLPPLKKQGEN